jgi:hypothetical protein
VETAYLRVRGLTEQDLDLNRVLLALRAHQLKSAEKRGQEVVEAIDFFDLTIAKLPYVIKFLLVTHAAVNIICDLLQIINCLNVKNV